MKESADYRKIIYDRYVSSYRQLSAPAPDYAAREQKLRPLLEPWLSDCQRSGPCLDLACGPGFMIYTLRNLGFQDVAGVDVSREQIDLACKISDQAECGDMFNFLEKRRPDTIQLITAFDVLEHLTKVEILDLLKLIHSRLKPGGRFIAHLPNGDSPWATAVMATDFTHETLLNARSAETACRVAGFEAFKAAEHLGASTSIKGRIRALAWQVQRALWRTQTLVECGHRGSTVLTRNFAFMALKASTEPTAPEGGIPA